jgi:hypothetical protein
MGKNADIIVTFARLWGQKEALCLSEIDEKVRNELTAYDSEECLALLTEWANEYMNLAEEDTVEFFEKKLADLLQ